MTFPLSLSPIIERELRQAARRPLTYWGRVTAAILAVTFTFWLFLLELGTGRATRSGQTAFGLLAFAAAMLVLSHALRLSTAAFAREKREDTLGLLFLTPLRPLDLVLGKLLSSALPAMFQFVAILPVLGIPILVGGVRLRDFLLLVLGLMDLAFIATALGLCISARNWDEKRANNSAFVWMLALLILLPALAAALASIIDMRSALWALCLSPGYPIAVAAIPGFAPPWTLYFSLLWTTGLAVFFLYDTCRTLPNCWQQPPSDPLRPQAALQGFDRVATLPVPTVRSEDGTKARQGVVKQYGLQERGLLMEVNPILWFALRWRPQSSAAWVIGCCSIVTLVFPIVSGELRFLIHPGAALFIFLCLNGGFKVFLATQASFAFARDRQSNPLELLLSTPITPRQLVGGFEGAFRATMQPWIRRLLIWETGWLAFTILLNAAARHEGTLFYICASAALLGFLVPDLYAVGWTALWAGVVAKNSHEAEKSATTVLVLPWLLSPIFSVVLGWLGASDEKKMLSIVGGWIVFSAATNWFYGKKSRQRLMTDLLPFAQARAWGGEVEVYNIWRRLGRALGKLFVNGRRETRKN